MKVLLVYFTGTYNTRYLTDRITDEFVSCGHQVDRVEINKDTPIADTNGYDVIGFSYPIYGFNTPLAFDKYLKKLKFNHFNFFCLLQNGIIIIIKCEVFCIW